MVVRKLDIKVRGYRGFTLIELMIVVTIVAVLAAIASPKFADMIRRAKEGATKGNLGSLRSAMSIYYSANEGRYPYVNMGGFSFTLDALTVGGRYIAAIPVARIPDYHPDSSSVDDQGIWNAVGGIPGCNGNYIDPDSGGSSNGGWAYYNPRSVALVCAMPPDTIAVNCFHTDSKGTIWTNY